MQRVPPPRWREYPQTRALVFDSLYDSYRGCIAYVRIFSGAIKAGDMMMLMSTGQKAEVKEVGVFMPKMEKIAVARRRRCRLHRLQHQDPSEVKTGDTITIASKPATEMLPGYKEVRPLVFCGLYPLESDDYEKLKAALGRLRNSTTRPSSMPRKARSRSASAFAAVSSACSTWKSSRSASAASTTWRSSPPIRASSITVVKHGGEMIDVDNPVNMPDPGTILEIKEPTIRAQIILPNDAMGDILSLIMEKRGVCDHTDTLDMNRVMLTLRAAAQRNPRRFQRSPEEHHPRLRLDGLRTRRIPRLPISSRWTS